MLQQQSSMKPRFNLHLKFKLYDWNGCILKARKRKAFLENKFDFFALQNPRHDNLELINRELELIDEFIISLQMEL